MSSQSSTIVQHLWNTCIVFCEEGLCCAGNAALKSVAFLTPFVYTKQYPPRFFGTWVRGRESGLCLFCPRCP